MNQFLIKLKTKDLNSYYQAKTYNQISLSLSSILQIKSWIVIRLIKFHEMYNACVNAQQFVDSVCSFKSVVTKVEIHRCLIEFSRIEINFTYNNQIEHSKMNIISTCACVSTLFGLF